MEVAQHIGNHTVRCIMLASSDGLSKDMEVTATVAGISRAGRKRNSGDVFLMFWVKPLIRENNLLRRSIG